ncbi:MAG: ATP-binding protein [Eubacteriales bacterium]
MILKLLHIISFGGLSNRDIRLEDGVNVLYGPNESGKSSVAMFVKFVFYGLSSKATRSGEPSEKARCINRLTGQAAGYILLETDAGVEYRLERAILTSDNAPTRERVRIINMSTGESLTGKDPGEYFFGVPEEVFMNTCFVGQASLVRPDAGSVGSAVENMLTSADETVDVKKAIRALDNVRREICHKNGTGGELNELREKRAALLEDMKNSSGRSAEIISVSTSLSDIKKRIQELWADKQKYDGIFSSLDKILLKRRIDSAEQTEKSIAALRETLAELDASPLGGGFSEAVDEAERDIRAYAEACAAYGQSLPDHPDVPDVFPEDGDPDGSEEEGNASDMENPAQTARRLDTSAHVQFTAAMALFVAGLFGLAASLLMYYFNTDTYLLPLLMTLAFVSLGVFFILRHAHVSASLTRLLEEWHVETIDELEQLYSSPAVPEGDTEDTEGEEGDAPSAPGAPLLEQARQRFDRALLRVDELCETAGVEVSDNLYDTLDRLRATAADICADRDAMTAKLSNLTGKLEVLNEQLVGVDRVNAEYEYLETVKLPWGKTASELNADGIKSMMRERDFTNSALKSAEKRQHELENRLAALGSLFRNPDETATAINDLDRQIEELSLRHDACELAKSALLQAGEKMRSGVIPKIAQSASILLSGATSGVHENLTLDGNFNAGCSTETDLLSGEYLSRGTADLAYLSLRIALAEEIFKTEAPFMIFDETFAHIDADRIRSLTSLMLDGQYLILTCHREEANAAAAGGAAMMEMR